MRHGTNSVTQRGPKSIPVTSPYSEERWSLEIVMLVDDCPPTPSPPSFLSTSRLLTRTAHFIFSR